MSHSTDIEQRLREAMDGVTPGPWELVSLSGYGSPFSIRMAYTSSSPNAPKTHYGVQSVRTREDAVYIALCSPDNISALLDTIASLRSRLEEADGARGWQPIETAPKDGTRVWLKNGQMRQPVIGQIDDYLSEFSGTVSRQWIVTHDPYDRFMPLQYGSLCVPTHWMPLASLREADHA